MAESHTILDNRAPSHSLPPARHPSEHRSADEGRESEEQECRISLRLMAAALQINTRPIKAPGRATINKRIAARELELRAAVYAQRDGHGLGFDPSVSPALSRREKRGGRVTNNPSSQKEQSGQCIQHQNGDPLKRAEDGRSEDADQRGE